MCIQNVFLFVFDNTDIEKTYLHWQDTNVIFEKLVSASATLDEEEECYSYSMTMEASDKRLYDAHVLYKLDKVEMYECFFIRPTNSCS